MSSHIPSADHSSALSAIQQIAFVLLLVFAPLARGATTQWAFCIALWLALVAFCGMTARRLLKGQSPLPRSGLDFPIATLLFLTIFSLFGSINRDATVWALLRLFLYCAVFWLAVDITDSRRLTRFVIHVVVGMGMLISFLGLVGYSGAPFPSFWKSDPFSLTSTFVNRNHLGGYLAMVFALGLGVAFRRAADRVLMWGGVLLLILVSLCLSMSRGAWIGALVGIELMLLLLVIKKEVSRWKTGLVAFGLIIVVGMTSLGSNSMFARIQTLKSPENTDLYERSVVWRGCFQLIRDNPLLGTGLGTFSWSYTDYRPPGLTARWSEAHNDYLQIVTELGILVIIPLVWGLIVIFRTGLRSCRATPSRLHAGAVIGSLGGITAILVHSISDFNIQITSNGVLFACLAGLVMGRYSWTKR